MQIQLYNQTREAGTNHGGQSYDLFANRAFLLQLAVSADENALNTQHTLLSVGALQEVDVNAGFNSLPAEGQSIQLLDKVDSLAGFLSTDFLLNQQNSQSFVPEQYSDDFLATTIKMLQSQSFVSDGVPFDFSAGAGNVHQAQSFSKLIHKIGLTYWGFCASGQFASDTYSVQWTFQQSLNNLFVLSSNPSVVKWGTRVAPQFQQPAATRADPSYTIGVVQFKGDVTAEITFTDDVFYAQQSPSFSSEWQKEMLKIQLHVGQAVVFYRNFGENQHSTLSALQDWFDRQELQQVYWYVNGVGSQGRVQDGS
jgi:hypothetical protein